MGVIRACVERMAESAPWVSVQIKLDYRARTTPGALTRDVQSIERRLWAGS
jgi:hypothetical protein